MDEEGTVFVWGDNKCGQLGALLSSRKNGETLNKSTRKIVCGSNFCIDPNNSNAPLIGEDCFEVENGPFCERNSNVEENCLEKRISNSEYVQREFTDKCLS